MFYVPKPTTESTSQVVENEKTQNTELKSLLPDYETELNILREKDLNFIRDYALCGKLRSSKFRSIYWRTLLCVLPISPSEWQKSIRDLRCKYNALKSNFMLDPHRSPCPPDDNPLSQDTNSVWYRYFCDTELRRVIRQDVVRTSPERQFFQSARVQEIMIDVLFIYARENPDICYRQGMHEILALLLYVIHEDCQKFKEHDLYMNNSTLAEILDTKYLEHDLFYLFAAIMKRMERFYESDYSSIPNACGHFPSLSTNDAKNNGTLEDLDESGISMLVHSVIRNNLAVNDPMLYQYLKKLNIPFTAFGIRWLRLIFGREYSLTDLCVLWDAVFAVDCGFILVDHVLVAMLIAIRNELVNRDYVHCLNNLMNYPRTVDISFIVRLALYLKDPKVYKRPMLPITTSKNEFGKVGTNDDVTRSRVNNQQSNKSSMGNSKKTRNLKLNLTKNSSSVEGNQKCSNSLSSKNYEKMVTELKHIRVVMSLCKLKLYQYHDILASSVADDDTKAHHALTGIQELCTLLEIDHFSLKSSPNDNSEVKAAYEAENVSPAYANGEPSSHATEDVVTMFLPPPKSDIDMKTFSCIERLFTDASDFPSECPHKKAEPNASNANYKD